MQTHARVPITAILTHPPVARPAPRAVLRAILRPTGTSAADFVRCSPDDHRSVVPATEALLGVSSLDFGGPWFLRGRLLSLLGGSHAGAL